MDLSSNKQFVDLAEWLDTEVGRDFLDDQRNEHHPFGQAWRICKKGIDKYEASKDEAIPRVLGFIHTIRKLSPFSTRDSKDVIKEDNGFINQLMQRSKISIADFDSVELEAIVAWAFSGIPEQPILALEPGNSPTSDFEITINRQLVFIECKARTTTTPEHQQIDLIRNELIHRVHPLLKQAPANYGLLLSAVQTPKRDEIAGLLKVLRSLLTSGAPFSRTFGNFRIEGIIFLASDLDIITTNLQPLGRSEHVPEPVRSFMINNGVSSTNTYAGVYYQCQMHASEGSIYCRNPRALVVHIDVTPDHIRATARFIKDAKRQLQPDAIGIVAIRAPDLYGHDQFARLGQAIKSELNATKRVSGVLLFHQAIIREDIKPDGVKAKLWWQVLWISNDSAKYPISENFIHEHLAKREGLQLLNRMK